MLIKSKSLWVAYGLLILLLAVQEAYYLFAPDSPISLYYLILRTLDPVFSISYSAHILRLLLDIIHFLPLLLYAYHVRFLPATFWQYLFIFRCFFEITGNSYEVATLVAFSHTDPSAVGFTVISLLLPKVPSYLACFWYAFRQEKLFA